ncbi:UbiA family prenyltransferase [Aliifodinibius salicampi]|uniref:UbiA family prenyltransferase n=1 Tax=Fodinibius salicampi TaxID=1920655 RepID=A0ABT3PY30_9BACT|nr:UbiA family prenyltransferase [Fodinibius salicampi]MCW9712751.1 UbiA family prenyltransferase [Fodinibius salicampi]
MPALKGDKTSRRTQIWHFLLHLRLHYQLFILSGPFLLGALLSENFNTGWFLVQFFNIHVLLFGGATAYNSFWDRDKGPIGGLTNPPEMTQWMWFASLLIQMIGLLIALPVGTFFVGIYVLSILLFWLYSSPWTRWKGHPHKSLFAIGISTGFNSVLMGYYATGFGPLYPSVWIAGVGATLILLSLYPISQLYQQEEDRDRGDRTFAISYGRHIVIRFFESTFILGLLLTALAITLRHLRLGLVFGVAGIIIGLLIHRELKKVLVQNKETDEYKSVMQIKYRTSLAFVSFLILALLAKHYDFLHSLPLVEWFMQ